MSIHQLRVIVLTLHVVTGAHHRRRELASFSQYGFNMFRITKKFENSATYLYRIEGTITDEVSHDWQNEMVALQALGRQVILDFSGVWFISPQALEILLHNSTDKVFILNCGMEVRNLFHASGLAARMLE